MAFQETLTKQDLEDKLFLLEEEMRAMVDAMSTERGDTSRKAQAILCMRSEINLIRNTIEEMDEAERLEEIDDIEFDEEELSMIEERYDEEYALSPM